MSAHRRYHVGDLSGRLIREARAMLKESGLRQLNLRALATRAGITAGSIYHHYESKTELLGVLAAGGFIELRLELERATREVELIRRLRAWAIAYADLAEREAALFAVMFDPEIAVLPVVEEARAAVIAQLRGIVSEVAATYGRSEQRLDEITLAVWAAAHGAASLGTSSAAHGELMGDVIVGLEALFTPPPSSSEEGGEGGRPVSGAGE